MVIQSTQPNPGIVVSQERGSTEKTVQCDSANFILVDGPELHLWIDGIHFKEDDDGAVRSGQHFIVHDPGMGYTLSRIESIETNADVVTVQHLAHWCDGNLEFPETTEEWTTDEIMGEYNRSIGDSSTSSFLVRMDQSD